MGIFARLLGREQVVQLPTETNGRVIGTVNVAWPAQPFSGTVRLELPQEAPAWLPKVAVDLKLEYDVSLTADGLVQGLAKLFGTWEGTNGV